MREGKVYTLCGVFIFCKTLLESTLGFSSIILGKISQIGKKEQARGYYNYLSDGILHMRCDKTSFL